MDPEKNSISNVIENKLVITKMHTLFTDLNKQKAIPSQNFFPWGSSVGRPLSHWACGRKQVNLVIVAQKGPLGNSKERNVSRKQCEMKLSTCCLFFSIWDYFWFAYFMQNSRKGQIDLMTNTTLRVNHQTVLNPGSSEREVRVSQATE